ncbi:MAG: hypothetical protein JW993_09975 [Sedimentisphaerales bacterium]|nr:hypothetical protein [Sedimentisphaerales bacterium]
MDTSHYQIIGATLSGRRPVDEHTHTSLAVLTERLEGVKSHGGLFAGVAFSGDAERLRQRCEALPVG